MQSISKHSFRIIAAIVITSLVLTPVSYAIDKKFFAGNEIIIYDPDGNTCNTGSIKKVSIETKIGQLLNVGFDNKSVGDLEKIVKQYQLGAVYLNISSSADFNAKTTAERLNKGGLNSELLVASDDEGGQVRRVLDKNDQPSAKELGKMSNSKVLAAGKDTGTKLKKAGVNMVLAPVLDIDTGLKNAISPYDRSFSSNPNTIATKAGAWANGVSSQYVGVTYKHFPGIGSNTGNTDETYVIAKDKPKISDYEKDLIPYKNKELMGTRGASVMLANFVLPEWGNSPVSMSPKAVTYLRNTLSFSGLITTDDLSVLSGSGYGDNKVDLKTAVIKALTAKVDMPLFTYPGDAELKAVIEAVKAEVSESVIDAAYANVMAYKTSLSLATRPTESVGGGSAPTVSGSDNRTKIWNFLISNKFEGYGNQAFGAVQAAGAVGNFFQESGWRFDAVEQPSGIGHGIAQWSFDRKTTLFKLANQMGKKWSDPEVQFKMVQNELDGWYGERLLAAGYDKLTDPVEASLMFQKIYEGAGIPAQEKRDKAAVEAYEELAGLEPGTSFSSGCGEGDGNGSGDNNAPTDMNTSGASAVTKDGFPIYLQCDERWGLKSYGSGTICHYGCAPTAMAMAITALTGKVVLPPETSKKAADAGMFIPGNGSAWETAAVLAEMYGLKSKKLSKSVKEIEDVIKNGGYVYLDGRGSRPFIATGHYVLVYGITDDGKWKIANSGWKAELNKTYTPEHVLSMTVAGTIYGITR